MDISDEMMEGFPREKNRNMSPSMPGKKSDSEDDEQLPMVFDSQEQSKK